MWNVHSVLSIYHIFKVSYIGLKRKYHPGQFLPNTLPDYLLVGFCVSFWLCLPAPLHFGSTSSIHSWSSLGSHRHLPGTVLELYILSVGKVSNASAWMVNGKEKSSVSEYREWIEQCGWKMSWAWCLPQGDSDSLSIGQSQHGRNNGRCSSSLGPRGCMIGALPVEEEWF